MTDRKQQTGFYPKKAFFWGENIRMVPASLCNERSAFGLEWEDKTECGH
jgi:hypothetical protein